MTTMPTQYHEARDLMDTLVGMLGVIVDSSSADLEQIAGAYSEARNLAGTIPWDGSARLRIVACLERYNTLKKANDIRATGWMLTAIQERIAQKDLPEWDALRTVADHAVYSLLNTNRRLH